MTNKFPRIDNSCKYGTAYVKVTTKIVYLLNCLLQNVTCDYEMTQLEVIETLFSFLGQFS